MNTTIASIVAVEFAAVAHLVAPAKKAGVTLKEKADFTWAVVVDGAVVGCAQAFKPSKGGRAKMSGCFLPESVKDCYKALALVRIGFLKGLGAKEIESFAYRAADLAELGFETLAYFSKLKSTHMLITCK